MLCDHCHENQASVFVTKMTDNQTSKVRLCEDCARSRALDEGWLEGLEVDPETPLEELMLKLFTHLGQGGADELARVFEDDKWSLETLAALDRAQRSGEFPADEDLVDAIDEMDDDDFDIGEMVEDDFDDAEFGESPFGDFDPVAFMEEMQEIEDDAREDDKQEVETPKRSRGIPALRCPKCETTWDRLRQDGRVGCASCYEIFADQLNEVMGRLQQAAQHVGKTPRAATRRTRRLEHLRARRDHRLEMLRERLNVALKAEDYEEAARVRDKIKMVESTIVQESEERNL